MGRMEVLFFMGQGASGNLCHFAKVRQGAGQATNSWTPKVLELHGCDPTIASQAYTPEPPLTKSTHPRRGGCLLSAQDFLHP